MARGSARLAGDSIRLRCLLSCHAWEDQLGHSYDAWQSYTALDINTSKLIRIKVVSPKCLHMLGDVTSTSPHA